MTWFEWDARKGKGENDKEVKCMGLRKWNNDMEQTKTLKWKWYKDNE